MRKKLFTWASAHQMTPQQQQELEELGMVELLEEVHPELYRELTNLSADSDLDKLATKMLDMAIQRGCIIVQPAGSPAFHTTLGKIKADWRSCGSYIPVWFAHSKRESKDIPQEDGSVKKVSVFTHEGWIKV